MQVLIVGAGPAGLACAGALKMRGVEALVLDRADTLAASWRAHYDRLHLHTARRYSGLPGMPMPADYPRYPSRQQVVEYLESYALHHGIEFLFDTEVTRINKGIGWRVTTDTRLFTVAHVIVATGLASTPKPADWPGLDGFGGPAVHSSAYRNAAPFDGKRVLVVGFGNSGGEIALDLAEAGIATTMAVRSPVNVIPRDVLGLPAQTFSILERHLPPRLVDGFNGAISRLTMGDITRLGLPKASVGPVEQIVTRKRIPLIDIGTLAAIRDGRIAVRGGIDRFDGPRVTFADGQTGEFDAVILATGYAPDLREMLPDAAEQLSPAGQPLGQGQGGLWFCGFDVVPTGMLRQIGIEAQALARVIADS